MRLTISVAALAAAMAGPVLAQDASTITCADFMAMDEAAMNTALDRMSTQTATEAGGAMDTSGTATDTASADATADMSADPASTDMASADAGSADAAATDTASTDAASTEMASTDTATDADAAATDTTAEAGSDAAVADAAPMSMDDPLVQAMMEACTADPSMAAMDAYTQASTM